MTDSIRSNKAPEPVGPYPHAKKVGNLLFLSGIGPRKPGMKKYLVLNWMKLAILFPMT